MPIRRAFIRSTQSPNNLTDTYFHLLLRKLQRSYFACDANESNKRTKRRKTRSTETQLITICLATYVQRRIERREKLPPRKVPTHLEITGKKSVTNGVAWDVQMGSRLICMVCQHSAPYNDTFVTFSSSFWSLFMNRVARNLMKHARTLYKYFIKMNNIFHSKR